MFGILLSSINTALGWLVQSVLVKFVVFFGLFFITSEFLAVISPLIPNANSLNGALGNVPSSIAYFLDVFAVKTGISMLVSAYTTRFSIRKVPVIG